MVSEGILHWSWRFLSSLPMLFVTPILTQGSHRQLLVLCRPTQSGHSLLLPEYKSGHLSKMLSPPCLTTLGTVQWIPSTRAIPSLRVLILTVQVMHEKMLAFANWTPKSHEVRRCYEQGKRLLLY